MIINPWTGRTVVTSLFFLVLLLLCAMPGASSAEKDVIPGANFASADLVRGTPPGWVLDRRAGTVNLRLEKAGDNFAVRFVSDRNSSFGIKRELHVDLKEYPFLNWRWKTMRLPKGGDVRKAATDDQALQFYVAFPSLGFPAVLNSPVIGYVWDNEAPRGWTGRSDQIGGGKLRYVVVRNKADLVGEWYTESRNVYEDFKKLFRDLKGVSTITHGIQLHINSQNTKSDAESLIGDVFFSRQDTKGMSASAPLPFIQ